MRRAAVLAAALAAGLSCSHQTPFRFPTDLDVREKFHYSLDLEMFKLANGLTVVLAPADDTNVVVVDARYEVGSSSDPAGQTGIAHFVEHLSFLEHAGKDSAMLWDRFATAALSYNAFTTPDSTDYISLGLASNWTQLIGLEAARMGGTCDSFDDALFERERGVVEAEIAERGTADVLDPLLRATFGAAHPYGHSTGGTDVPTITRGDVCAFMKAHYAPDHAVLVVSGAIDRQAMRRVIAALFGGIAASGTPAASDVPPLDPEARKSVELVTTLDTPIVALAFPSPAWGTDDATHHQVAEILLQRALNKVADAEADIDSISVFDLGGMRGGVTYVAAIGTKTADLATIEAKVRRGIADAATTKADDEFDIGAWRAYLYAGIVGRYEDLNQRGDMIADYLQFTSRDDFQLHDLELTHGLNDADVVAYAQAHFVKATPLVIRIQPEKQHDPKAHHTELDSVRRRITKDLSISRQPVDEREAERALKPPAGAPSQRLDEITLDNGLRVVFAPRPGSSLFEARMVFPTGNADDPPDAPGTARLAAEKLSTDYKRQFTYAQYDVIMAGLGVGTSYDEHVTESATVIGSSGLAAWAQWHLWHLHLKLEAGAYDAADLKDETGTSGGDDDEAEARRRAIMAKLYGADHPYARASKHAAPAVAALDAFRRDHYVTQGATLIVSGAFDRRVIEHDIRELWGAWPKRAAQDVRAVPPADPTEGLTVFVSDDDDASQVHVGVAVLAGSTLRARRPARAVAKELIDLRLAAIREEMAASYGVYASYRTTAAGDMLEISGDLDPSRAGDALARISAELTALHDHGDAQRADFVRARRAALAKAMAQEGSASGAADLAQDVVVHQLPLDYFEQLPSQIGAVSPDDIASLLHADLDPAHMVIVVTGPHARAAAEAAGLANITELPKATAKTTTK